MSGSGVLDRITKEDCKKLANYLGVSITEEEIFPGDMYIAGRNTEPVLLTASYIENGCIYPTTIHYPYAICECYKVKE
jgi:hypothetical protein